MKCGMNNERGFALVFGLVILVLATVGGTAILFMTQKDRSEATDYAKMRSASMVAVAALRACEGQFQNDPTEALAILTQFKANQAFKWMLGTAANANSEHKISFGTAPNASQYSARIVAYDESKSIVILEGIGTLNNGGKKKALAAYQLAGLGLSDRPIGSTYGLYLGGRLQNCNAIVSIKGDVYLSLTNGDPQHFNKGGIIYGNFKTIQSGNSIDLTGSGSLTVTGNALIQCRMSPQALLLVKGGGGFTNTSANSFYNFTTAIQINGNAYFTHTSNYGSTFANCFDGDNGGGKTAYYNTGSINADRFKDFGSKIQIPTSTADYVAGQLGMTAGSESPMGLLLPSWGTGVVETVTGTLTGENVDSYWNTHKSNNTLFLGEWLVLQVGSGGASMNGGTFTKKAIWLVTGSTSISANKKWYNCDAASNTLIIVKDNAFLQNMGVADNGRFRGLIYVSSTSSNMIYQFGTKDTLYGAIIHAGSASFNLNDGPTDSLRLWYSEPLGQSAIQDIVNTGIILAPGVTTPAARTPMVFDTKIRPTMISIQL